MESHESESWKSVLPSWMNSTINEKQWPSERIRSENEKESNEKEWEGLTDESNGGMGLGGRDWLVLTGKLAGGENPSVFATYTFTRHNIIMSSYKHYLLCFPPSFFDPLITVVSPVA